MFKNLKIGLRLALGFSLIIVLMVLLIIVGILQMNTDRDTLNRIVKENNVRISLANKMIDNAREVALSVRGILLKKYNNQSEASINEAKIEWENRWKAYNLNITEMGNLISKECQVCQNMFREIRASSDTARQLTSEAIDITLAGNINEATNFVFSKAYPSVQRWIKCNQDFILHSDGHAETFYDEAHAGQIQARITMLILGILSITLSVLIVIFLTLSITRPLNLSVHAANRIASGDLTADISITERKDEVGDLSTAFRQMVENLRGSVKDINEGVNILGSSASEILAATTQVASGTAETATAITETSTTVEEVQQAAKLSAQKAKNVADSAQKLAQVSQNGQIAVDETVNGMNRIREQMDSIAQTVVRLSEQSQSIGGIIASVTDIADQSNLLAVNAAIEAAKAGEQGKGFAVVAQEIKNLAEQSKQSTSQVRNILNDVQKATSAAVMATEQGSKAVEAGVKQSAQAGEAIRVLSESSNEAVQAAIQIVASSQQQVIGMDQIGVAMQNINQAGTETAVSMVQSEKAAKNLNELGQKLKELVERFKV
jgi:methyl-accepting chemotaxis protein